MAPEPSHRCGRGSSTTAAGPARTERREAGKLRFYEWDYTHGHIEVFDRNGDHLGTADPISGDVDQGAAVPGRTLGD